MKQLPAAYIGGAIPQVIILTGDDYLGREKAREKLLEGLQKPAGEVIQEYFDSFRESFTSYIERIITPSLFPVTRLFHLRHAQNLSEKEIQKLDRILDADFPDVHILIECEQKETRKKNILQMLNIAKREKADSNRFAILNFERPPDYKIIPWLMVQVPLLFGRQVTKGGAETLIELVGYELDRLYSELQKLDILLPDKAGIDKETVEHIIGSTRSMTAFELAKALAQKDLSRSLTILTSLFNDSFYAPSCIAAIYHHFWKVIKIRAYAVTHREKANSFFKAAYQDQMRIALEIGIATGIMSSDDSEKKSYPIMILSGLIDQARSFQYDHLKRILRWLREFDVGIKTGKIKGTQQNVEQLCYSIVRVAELNAKDAQP